MDLPERIDHLVWATPDLEAGVARVEALLGTRSGVGGSHPGYGTRNALFSLGPTTYLEVIGPDRDRPEPEEGRVFGIDSLETGRLVTWVARADDVPARVAAARAGGVALGAALSGERRRPDGSVLTWVLSDPRVVVADGLVPFLIDWSGSDGAVHPATTSPPGGALVSLCAEHPDPEAVRAALRVLDLELAVERGPTPALIATIRAPSGVVELR